MVRLWRSTTFTPADSQNILCDYLPVQPAISWKMCIMWLDEAQCVDLERSLWPQFTTVE